MVAKKNEKSTDVVKAKDWSSVTSWEAATAEFQYVADAADAFGDGVKLVKDKHTLIDQEFMVLEIREVQDKNTFAEYVNILAIARNGNKFCFNDGSTGVAQQARDWVQRTGQTGGIYCQRGLRVSEYEVEVDGRLQKAETFYFA